VDDEQNVIHPWYSTRGSSRLSIVACYFGLCGALAVAAAVYAFVHLTISAVGPLAGRAFASAIILSALGILWLQTARLLWQRRKRGAIWALASLVLFGLNWDSRSHQRPVDLALVLIAGALIAMSWKELKD